MSVVESELYSNLDILSEEDNLKNIDKKIEARKKLVEFLMTKKTIVESETSTFTDNESLLHTVLANNFNVLYNHTMTEEEKKELKSILSITNEELKTNFKTLQEEVSGKLNEKVLTESDEELRGKLNLALKEMDRMDATKYNYYKLLQLKNGL